MTAISHNIELRELLPQDATAYREIRRRGLVEYPSYFRESLEEFDQRSINDLSLFFETCSIAGGRFIVGAIVEGELVGVVGLFRGVEKKTEHSAVLGGMYVLPEFRGCGVGSGLITKVIELVRANGSIKRVRLSVESSNDSARRLYQRFGFSRYGIEPDVLRVEDRCYGEHHMTLEIPPES